MDAPQLSIVRPIIPRDRQWLNSWFLASALNYKIELQRIPEHTIINEKDYHLYIFTLASLESTDRIVPVLQSARILMASSG